MGAFSGVSCREPKAKDLWSNKLFVCRKRFQISAENRPSPCRPLATAFGQNFPHFAAFIGKLRKKRRHRPFFFLI